MLRTQIYLPEGLREEIDHHRAQTGESLSDYLRKAAERRVKQAKKLSKKDARAAVIKALEAIDPEKSGWKGIDPVKWQRGIREDRL